MLRSAILMLCAGTAAMMSALAVQAADQNLKAVQRWVCTASAPLLPGPLAFGRGGVCAAWLPNGWPRANNDRTIDVPADLSPTWTLVPLPLGSWGASVEELRSVTLAANAEGILRALGVQLNGDVPVPCGRAEESPRAVRVPARVLDANAGVIGPLRNRVGTYSGRGATVQLTRRAVGRSMSYRLECANPSGGFCGLWVEAGDMNHLADQSASIDAEKADEIVIRGRGTARGKIGVSDVQAARRDEPVIIGSLATARRSGADWIWRQAIPASINRKQLRSLVIDLSDYANAELEIAGVWFVGRRGRVPGPTRFSARRTMPVNRGLWVWNTRELITQKADVDGLIRQARDWGITEIYLQLPHDPSSPLRWQSETEQQLAALVRKLRQSRLRVHALDGMPQMALPEMRESVIELARAVRDYNRRCGRSCRFDALHFDAEPYLLPEFTGRRRERLLDGFAETLTAVKSVISPLPLWLDVPFWYDEGEEQRSDGKSACLRHQFLRRAIRLADGIVIMSYRTMADGADGIGMHVLGEAFLADQLDRRLYFAVETVPLPPENEWLVKFDTPVVPGAGQPLAVMPRGRDFPHLLFSLQPSSADVEWLQSKGSEYRPLSVQFIAGAPSTKVTFDGRDAAAIDRVVSEALDLLRRSGASVDGVAYHESRTLPVR